MALDLDQLEAVARAAHDALLDCSPPGPKLRYQEFRERVDAYRETLEDPSIVLALIARARRADALDNLICDTPIPARFYERNPDGAR